jgi:hypothetical protein
MQSTSTLQINLITTCVLQLVALARPTHGVVIDSLKRLLGSRIEIGPHDGGMHSLVWFSELKSEQLPIFLNKAAAVGLGLYPVHPHLPEKTCPSWVADRVRGIVKRATPNGRRPISRNA